MTLRLSWLGGVLAGLSIAACGDDGGGSTGTSGGASAGSSEDSTAGQQSTGSTADVTTNAETTSTTSETSSTGATSESSATGEASTGSTGAAACGDAQQLEAWPTSGLLISFDAAGDHAHVLVDNEDTIAYVDAWLIKPDVPIGIPGGPTELDGTFNPGYAYRLVPTEVTFASVWVEVCDAAPCYIEADPEAWFDNPNQWCPWSFELDTIYDCRDGDGSNCPILYP